MKRGRNICSTSGREGFFEMIQRRRHLIAAIGALLILIGCTSARHSESNSEANTPLVWPAPPDVARIAHAQEVRGPGDLGVRVSAFTRFGHWLTGSGKGNETFMKPFGVAFDENDNLCLTDTGANVVCYYDRSKKKWQRWERVERVRFSSPVAVV